MSKPSKNLLTAAALVSALAISASGAKAYEQPDYQVVTKEGDYEVRRYAPYVIAETTVTGESERASNQAFMRLFRYFSGKQRKELRPDDPKIAMTVPVTMQYDGASTRMAFMVPGKYTLETAPAPADSSVHLRIEPGRLVAVFSYSGRSSQDRFHVRKDLLKSWIASHGFEASSEPLFAQYNGPFTPWFLRRNEVLIPIVDPEDLPGSTTSEAQ